MTNSQSSEQPPAESQPEYSLDYLYERYVQHQKEFRAYLAKATGFDPIAEETAAKAQSPVSRENFSRFLDSLGSERDRMIDCFLKGFEQSHAERQNAANEALACWAAQYEADRRADSEPNRFGDYPFRR